VTEGDIDMRHLRLFLSLAAGVALPIVAVGVVHNVLQAGVQTAAQSAPQSAQGQQGSRPPDLVAYYVIGAVVAWLCGVAGAWRSAGRCASRSASRSAGR